MIKKVNTFFTKIVRTALLVTIRPTVFDPLDKLYSNERYGNAFTTFKAYEKVQKVNLCK